MKKTIFVLLSICMIAVLIAACSTKEKEKDADESTKTEAVATADSSVSVYAYETDYCTLKLPEKWKDKLTITEDGDTLKFSGGKTALFDLSFNSVTGDVLGTIKSDDGNTVVCATVYDLKKDEKNYDELMEMRGTLDVILDHLQKDYDFVAGEALSDPAEDVFEIKTNLTSLYYPKRWESKVTVDVTDAGVSFSSGDTKLFDLVFGSDKGDPLGTYDKTEIRVVLYDPEQGKLSDDAFTELRAMRDDLNVIIEHLQEDELFQTAA